MPQVVVYALVGAALVMGYKLLKRAQERSESLSRVPVPIDTVRLERGSDGVFRPVVRR
ncbi:MAG: hypothetical protein P4L98_02935 [Ancalomicrobiaceae bacterium]|nr:hypothetical protein [Ancalomicrobiaceae bacterium]